VGRYRLSVDANGFISHFIVTFTDKVALKSLEATVSSKREFQNQFEHRLSRGQNLNDMKVISDETYL